MYSTKKYTNKIRNLEERLLNYKEKCKSKSEEIKTLRRQLRSKTKSCERWKGKAIDKRLENKKLSAKLSRKGKPPRHHYEMGTIMLSVMLRLVGQCSYRSIRRIFAVLNIHFKLNMTRLPCANSVENWVSKMGFSQLENTDVKLEGKEVCLIVDECKGIGNEMVLLVMACPAKKEDELPLSFKNAPVCHMHGQKSWTGDEISDVLKKIEASNNFRVSYVISDEASVMCKAAREYGKGHVLDISHAIASCLRKTFEKDAGYIAFTKQVASYQSKGVNRGLSYLRPPKQRTKARFMNINPVLVWAERLCFKFETLNEEEKEFFKDLSLHRTTMQLLRSCLNIAEEVSLLFKRNGVSKETILKARKETRKHIDIEGQLGCFSKLVNGYISQYEEFVGASKEAFNACSDIIESMFGKYKGMTKNTPYMGLSMVCLELPTYSIEQKNLPSALENALSQVFMSDLKGWNESKSSINQGVKRKEFFKK